MRIHFYHACLLMMCIQYSGLTINAQGLLLTNGSKLVVNGNAQLVIKDAGFTNNGTFIPANGTVSFTGNTATNNASISGLSVSDFYDLVLNKNSNGIRLKADINITNRLRFINGDSVFLNGYNINLGSTGTLTGERNGSRVTGATGGYLQRTQFIQAGITTSPGNLGIEITSIKELGNTVVRRGHTKLINMPAGTVSRYYDVVPVNNSGLTASVKFNYLDQETGGLPENNLVMYESTSAGMGWDLLGLSNADMTQNYVTKNGIDKLDLFILADLGTILPVKLINFNARLVNRKTSLSWSVADETDVTHYGIERSADAIHFNSLLTVQKKGINTGTINYETVDTAPLNGYNYYRLKIWDNTDHFTYSSIAQVYLDEQERMNLRIYPNPARDLIKLQLTSGTKDIIDVKIYDAKGSLVSSRSIAVNGGSNEISFDIHTLPAGNYFMQLKGGVSGIMQFIKQ